MINVPAIRLHQFGVFLYQAILGARDVDRSSASRCSRTATRRRTAGRRRRSASSARRASTGSSSRSASPRAPRRTSGRHPAEDLRPRRLLHAVRGDGEPARDPGAVLLVARPAARVHADELAPRARRPRRFPRRRACSVPSTASIACLALHQLIAAGQAEDVQVPAGRLRSPHPGSGRRAVRHHQREAHEAESVASR
jgi:hypothetical protein